MTIELDGSLRIAWDADGYRTIRVSAPRRSHDELAEFGRMVADEALVNRTVAALRMALRHLAGATFDLDTRATGGGEPYIDVVLHPPRGIPNPDD